MRQPPVPLLPDAPDALSAYRRLAVAVITQAVLDSRDPSIRLQSPARAWLDGGCQDVRFWGGLVGLDDARLRRLVDLAREPDARAHRRPAPERHSGHVFGG